MHAKPITFPGTISNTHRNQLLQPIVSKHGLLALSAAILGWLVTAGTAVAVPEAHASIEAYSDSSACMDCHGTKQHTDLMATSHWTWQHTDPASGQVLGKKNVINKISESASGAMRTMRTNPLTSLIL